MGHKEVIRHGDGCPRVGTRGSIRSRGFCCSTTRVRPWQKGCEEVAKIDAVAFLSCHIAVLGENSQDQTDGTQLQPAIDRFFGSIGSFSAISCSSLSLTSGKGM